MWHAKTAFFVTTFCLHWTSGCAIFWPVHPPFTGHLYIQQWSLSLFEVHVVLVVDSIVMKFPVITFISWCTAVSCSLDSESWITSKSKIADMIWNNRLDLICGLAQTVHHPLHTGAWYCIIHYTVVIQLISLKVLAKAMVIKFPISQTRPHLFSATDLPFY